jgi:FlgD Ig-like domain
MRPPSTSRAAWILAPGVLAAVLITAPAHAYDALTWYTFDGGGVVGSTGGAYRLSGTAGQPDAGSHSGAVFGLRGGFWRGGLGTQVGVVPGDAPRFAFRFSPAAPNPIRFHSRLSFELPSAEDVRIRVYDLAGRAVQSLAFGRLPAGPHDFVWRAVDDRGSSLPDGVYFMRLESGTSRAQQKVLVLK